MIGLGIGESRAKEYEHGLRNGGILIAVKPRSAEHRAEVRRALAEPRTTTGELDRSVDYAGEVRANPNRV